MNKLQLENNSLRHCIPEALGSLRELSELSVSANKLQGSLPEAIGSWALMSALLLMLNSLRGCIPDAIRSMLHIERLSGGQNLLSGPIPDSLGLMTDLKELELFENRITSSFPEGVRSWTHMIVLSLEDTSLSGSLPEAIRSWTQMEILLVTHTNVHGCIPDAMGAMMNLDRLVLGWNQMSGAVPDVLSALKTLRSVHLQWNKFAGSLPAWVFQEAPSPHQHVYLQCDSNRFSGSLGQTLSWDVVTISDNLLAGTLPFLDERFFVLLASRNLFEGTVSEIPKFMSSLDLSDQQGDHGRGLRGTLPSGLTRATRLTHLMVARQDLGGVIPSFMATMSILTVDNNVFSVLSQVSLNSPAAEVVLAHNNFFSCHLPACGNSSAQLSLAALGNQMWHPDEDFPTWVSVLEHDNLLWTSEAEAFWLGMKAAIAGSFLVATVIVKLRAGRLAKVMTGSNCLCSRVIGVRVFEGFQHRGGPHALFFKPIHTMNKPPLAEHGSSSGITVTNWTSSIKEPHAFCMQGLQPDFIVRSKSC